jgi:hypothetical protein
LFALFYMASLFFGCRQYSHIKTCWSWPTKLLATIGFAESLVAFNLKVY